jgi:hypothetical protein
VKVGATIEPSGQRMRVPAAGSRACEVENVVAVMDRDENTPVRNDRARPALIALEAASRDPIAAGSAAVRPGGRQNPA